VVDEERLTLLYSLRDRFTDERAHFRVRIAMDLNRQYTNLRGSWCFGGVYFCGFGSRDGFDGLGELLDFLLQGPERRPFSRGTTFGLVDAHLEGWGGDGGVMRCGRGKGKWQGRSP